MLFYYDYLNERDKLISYLFNTYNENISVTSSILIMKISLVVQSNFLALVMWSASTLLNFSHSDCFSLSTRLCYELTKVQQMLLWINYLPLPRIQNMRNYVLNSKLSSVSSTSYSLHPFNILNPYNPQLEIPHLSSVCIILPEVFFICI